MYLMNLRFLVGGSLATSVELRTLGRPGVRVVGRGDMASVAMVAVSMVLASVVLE
jgi:hypothetical protein